MSDEFYMSRALTLARRGLYTTDPNPRVGCVLVNNGHIVGEGWHQAAGAEHAEINALARAGDQARGAIVFVTLEPCCHVGQTGPCTQAMAKAGVAEVVVAMSDPNPLVNGRGLMELQTAGVAVRVGVLEQAAQDLNPGFCSRMIRGRPYIRGKLAMSLDGRTAMASGESKWITSSEARRDVQRLRARSSAIMTGIETVLADDPSLTVRAEELDEHDPAPIRQPLRVIVDSRLRTPSSAKLLGLDGSTLIAGASIDDARSRPLTAAGAEVISVGTANGRTDLRRLASLLAERQINEVLLEAGPTLSGAMLLADLIDELIVYLAPVMMGDAARGLLHLPGLEHLDQAVGLRIIDIRAVGEDWRITAVPRNKDFN